MPSGTGVTALVTTYTTTGASIKVGSAGQISGTTVNNFTSPVIYTVIAADGTSVTYTVTVTITQIIWDPPGPESYLVTVKVVWPGNTTGISESLEVSRQVSYIFGC